MPLYQSLVKKWKFLKKNQFQICCVFVQTLFIFNFRFPSAKNWRLYRKDCSRI